MFMEHGPTLPLGKAKQVNSVHVLIGTSQESKHVCVPVWLEPIESHERILWDDFVLWCLEGRNTICFSFIV